MRILNDAPIPYGYHKGRVNVYNSHGQRWITNDNVEYQIKANDTLPNGFRFGRLKPKTETIIKQKQTKAHLQHHHYTNGIVEKQFSKFDEIPEGFKRGRLPTSKEARIKMSRSHKGKHHSDIAKQKISLHSNNNRQKAYETNVSRYGVKHISQCTDIMDKINDTKKMNGTFNSSKPENQYYQYLKEQYGERNVFRHFKDKERYPFYCDFYIKSIDTFIELNLHWTHGNAPYDINNYLHQSKLLEWQEKAKTSKYYQNAIYVWTDLDVRKRKIAEENKLNYQVLYNI